MTKKIEFGYKISFWDRDERVSIKISGERLDEILICIEEQFGIE